MSFTVVDVQPDTPEWLEVRRGSVGASEVAAVMGLSDWETPLDVYKSKLGVDRQFDEVLGFIGHESERIIQGWMERFSGLNVKLRPGVMATSTEFPHLHATFDRLSDDPFTVWQFKTAHQYMSHHWDEGIPDAYRVQGQAEMAIAGTQREAFVVYIGGREFRIFWETRDERFIRDKMMPTLEAFWACVESRTPPAPSTRGELAELWPDAAVSMEATDELAQRIEQRAFLLASAKEAQEDADKIQLELGKFMLEQQVDTFTRHGRKVLTYKPQKGRASLDRKSLEADHPGLVAQYMTQGAPFMVMRTYKEKSA